MIGQQDAIGDVIEDYVAGGNELIGMLESNQNAEKDRALADFEVAKAELSRTYVAAQRTIALGSKGAKESSVSALEEEWREQDDDLQSFIAESVEEE